MMAQEQAGLRVSFTYCPNFATAETKTSDWPSFARSVSTSRAYATKEQSIARAAIVGGVRRNEASGRADNVSSRTILTLDYDDLPDGIDTDEIELSLTLGLDCAFVAYSTFRHSPDAPRIRVMAPLSREVSAQEYAQLVDTVSDQIGLPGMDNCSRVVNQLMFLASHKDGVEPWSLIQDGGPLDVDAFVTAESGRITIAEDSSDGLDDLAISVASEPLDLTDDQVRMLLESRPAEGLDYDDWLRVGMAICHQTRGEGFQQWVDWSAKSSKHDPRHMRRKWRSFGGIENPVTMASIIHAVGGMRGEAVAGAASVVAMSLREEAEAINTREAYEAFKRRVQQLNDVQLPPDYRSSLAAIAHEVYGRGQKMGLREVKSTFKHVSRRAAGDGDRDAPDCPKWLEGWVYVEADCLFVNTGVGEYAIKREGFRAKFDRMPEVVALEMDAATYALNIIQIPTVLRGMYWPGQDMIFSTEGADYVNTYHPSGIPAADTIDADGQRAVDLFLQHVANTIEDEREQAILIDFMAYVYRNPGKRVHWGLLLWGIEGNGKTYFYKVMQLLLGRNAKSISTSMIERPFTDWAVGSLLVGIEEIRISGTNKWRILDQIKPMISNDTIAVEPKGGTIYHAPNFTSYMMTTNHMDAVPVSDNDRRYCAIFTKHGCKEDLFAQHGGPDETAEYFRRLFTETEKHIGAIGRYLADRVLSDSFDPTGRAPLTAGLDMMREANVSDERAIVEDAIEEHACEIIGDRVLDVTHLNALVMMGDGDAVLPSGRALSGVLRDMGYQPIRGRRVKLRNRAYHYVWYKVSGGMTDESAKALVKDWHDAEIDAPF